MVPLVVDSGAYSASTKKQTIDLDEWIAFCLKVQKKRPDVEFVNLDVIGDGGASYDNWVKMVKAGVNAIPVYHLVTEEKWLVKYMESGAEYVGLGAIANMETNIRIWSLDRIWETYLIDSDRMPKIKVHGMGLTSFPIMRRFPWYSVDSTAWLQAAMYGKIFVPHVTAGQWDYNRAPYQITLSLKSPKLKMKGLHITNVSPTKRQVLDKYIHENGFVLGETKAVTDPKTKEIAEEVIKPGLQNNYEQRCAINLKFFARYTQACPWPRPFKKKKPVGLGIFQQAVKV